MRKVKRRRIHRCGCLDCQQHPRCRVAEQHRAINRVLLTLDERNRRRFAGLLAIQRGRRSLSLLARITGLSRHTIRRGKREIEHPARQRQDTIRNAGGGRPPVEKNSQAS
ncbi:MAG: hypothetical protein HZB53_20765 [Chloroflexi bacterium]|nr:hypothetical protein [Chloroflexota bacterium]